MKTLKRILLFLLVAFVVAIVLVVAIDVPEMNRLRGVEADSDQAIKDKIAEIGEVNLKYRGFNESLASIPDSLRASQSGIMIKKGEAYRKQIFVLEREKRELERAARKNAKKLDAATTRVKQRLTVLGSAAIVLLLSTLVISRRSIRS
jgi:hypothetical protein